jgi:hypothetical protein
MPHGATTQGLYLSLGADFNVAAHKGWSGSPRGIDVIIVEAEKRTNIGHAGTLTSGFGTFIAPPRQLAWIGYHRPSMALPASVNGLEMVAPTALKTKAPARRMSAPSASAAASRG